MGGGEKAFILVAVLLLVAIGLLVGGAVALYHRRWIIGTLMLLGFGGLAYGFWWLLLITRMKNLH